MAHFIEKSNIKTSLILLYFESFKVVDTNNFSLLFDIHFHSEWGPPEFSFEHRNFNQFSLKGTDSLIKQ